MQLHLELHKDMDTGSCSLGVYVRLCNYGLDGSVVARAPRLFTCKYIIQHAVLDTTDGALRRVQMSGGAATLSNSKDCGVPEAFTFLDVSELEPHLVDENLVVQLIIEEIL
jgi:hypothetical protein